jgi:hypothetical protein
MITFLYVLWICYTVGSLSMLVLAVSLTILARWDQKRHDARIREMLTKRPSDQE